MIEIAPSTYSKLNQKITNNLGQNMVVPNYLR